MHGLAVQLVQAVPVVVFVKEFAPVNEAGAE